MEFSLTGQEKCDLLIQVTAHATHGTSFQFFSLWILFKTMAVHCSSLNPSGCDSPVIPFLYLLGI
jgi:hypothetical protein